MAKSRISEIYIRQAVDNLVCQRTDRRENDFAISITFGDSGSRKQNCHEQGASGELENPCESMEK
jgi:hypothetical protein